MKRLVNIYNSVNSLLTVWGAVAIIAVCDVYEK